jgi:predicted DNA-binding ribbon-helix-helix protein
MEIRPNRKERRRNSKIVKHSIELAGHKTSISLEKPFWDGLRVIAQDENISVVTLVERIDKQRLGYNLSSSIRLFVLSYFKALSRSSSSRPTSDLTPSTLSQAK